MLYTYEMDMLKLVLQDQNGSVCVTALTACTRAAYVSECVCIEAGKRHSSAFYVYSDILHSLSQSMAMSAPSSYSEDKTKMNPFFAGSCSTRQRSAGLPRFGNWKWFGLLYFIQNTAYIVILYRIINEKICSFIFHFCLCRRFCLYNFCLMIDACVFTRILNVFYLYHIS